MAQSTLMHYLVVSALLFGMGLIGFLTRRNLIIMFLCTELMFQGVALYALLNIIRHEQAARWALMLVGKSSLVSGCRSNRTL